MRKKWNVTQNSLATYSRRKGDKFASARNTSTGKTCPRQHYTYMICPLRVPSNLRMCVTLGSSINHFYTYSKYVFGSRILIIRINSEYKEDISRIWMMVLQICPSIIHFFTYIWIWDAPGLITFFRYSYSMTYNFTMLM